MARRAIELEGINGIGSGIISPVLGIVAFRALACVVLRWPVFEVARNAVSDALVIEVAI